MIPMFRCLKPWILNGSTPIFDGPVAKSPQLPQLKEDLEGTGELMALEVPTAIRSLGYQADAAWPGKMGS